MAYLEESFLGAADSVKQLPADPQEVVAIGRAAVTEFAEAHHD